MEREAVFWEVLEDVDYAWYHRADVRRQRKANNAGRNGYEIIVDIVCEAQDVLVERLESKLDDLVLARTDKGVASSTLVVDWLDVVGSEDLVSKHDTFFGGALKVILGWRELA